MHSGIRVHLIADGKTEEVIQPQDVISADVIKRDDRYYVYSGYRGNILIFKSAKVLDLDRRTTI